MRTGIIAIAKNEGLYVREWVDYHLSLGFDRIIIADNDDVLELSGLSSARVTVEDYTGVPKVQPKAYTELYRKYRLDFDWILFIDIDEFVVLDGPRDVKDFLKPFDCEVVRINCRHMTDSGMLDTDGDHSVLARFTEPYGTPLDALVKSFVNTRVELQGTESLYGHGLYGPRDARNALGDKCENAGPQTTRIVHKVCWLDHHPTKTVGEYIRQKYRRGDANGHDFRYGNWERYFFRTNVRTPEKVEYGNNLIKKLYN